jgi:prepilin-type N-terminal cleavage/methylation domain-containing protein
MDRKQNAFTLIELLVVIAIISMLLAILVPSLKIAKARAEEIVDEINTKSLGQGVAMYTNNNKNFFPSPTDWIYLNFNYNLGRFMNDASSLYNYSCAWHNPTLTPDGVVAQYLEPKVLLCGTFKKVAPSRCDCVTRPSVVTHNNDIPIVPQFNYSMNCFLGDIRPWTLPDNLKKVTMAKSPSTLLVLGEENPFRIQAGDRPTLPSGSQTSYNDCILYPINPAGAKAVIEAAGGKRAAISKFTLVDCLGTFHRAKDAKLATGNSKAVFADGHTQSVEPEESISLTWPY